MTGDCSEPSPYAGIVGKDISNNPGEKATLWLRRHCVKGRILSMVHGQVTSLVKGAQYGYEEPGKKCEEYSTCRVRLHRGGTVSLGRKSDRPGLDSTFVLCCVHTGCSTHTGRRQLTGRHEHPGGWRTY